MSDLLYWIGLATVITIIAIVGGSAILWLRDKLLVKRPPTQDPRATTSKKSDSQNMMKLERYEAVLRDTANDLVASGGTGGSTQLVQAVDDCTKAANKAIGRTRMWSVIMFVTIGAAVASAYEGGRSFLPGWLYPDYAERYIAEHPYTHSNEVPTTEAAKPQPALETPNRINRRLTKVEIPFRRNVGTSKAVQNSEPGTNPTPMSQPTPEAVATNAGKQQKRPEYSPEFERGWGGGKADSDFANSYEENYKRETGIGFNDSQKAYVSDVIVNDFKARLYKTFQSLGNSIPDEKVDAAIDAASAEAMKEVGPIHQGKLLAMMEGAQVAKLNSVLSGINAASPQPNSRDGYSPAFEYLWSGGQGDEYAAAILQNHFESMSGITFNKQQRDYIQNSLVPEWKSLSMDAFGKFDLSSGNVTGEDLITAFRTSMSVTAKNHFDKLYSMMDDDQLRIIDLRRSGKNKAK